MLVWSLVDVLATQHTPAPVEIEHVPWRITISGQARQKEDNKSCRGQRAGRAAKKKKIGENNLQQHSSSGSSARISAPPVLVSTMAPKGHRAGSTTTQLRTHSRSSSSTRVGGNLQLTQKEGPSTKGAEKTKKNPHPHEVRF